MISSPTAKSVTTLFRYNSLQRKLPLMALHWFKNVERISNHEIHLRFDAAAVERHLSSKKPLDDPDTRGVIVANSKWNMVWASYYVAVIRRYNLFYPVLRYGAENVVSTNKAFLDSINEPVFNMPDLDVIDRAGSDGFDMVVADIVGNSYTDGIWSGLVDGLQMFTSMRQSYLEHGSAATAARAIALAEIAWANEAFPWRDVTDMSTFEFLWNMRCQTPLFASLLKGANLVGAELPELSSKEIISRVAKNPGKPIEDVVMGKSFLRGLT